MVSVAATTKRGKVVLGEVVERRVAYLFDPSFVLEEGCDWVYGHEGYRGGDEDGASVRTGCSGASSVTLHTGIFHHVGSGKELKSVGNLATGAVMTTSKQPSSGSQPVSPSRDLASVYPYHHHHHQHHHRRDQYGEVDLDGYDDEEEYSPTCICCSSSSLNSAPKRPPEQRQWNPSSTSLSSRNGGSSQSSTTTVCCSNNPSSSSSSSTIDAVLSVLKYRRTPLLDTHPSSDGSTAATPLKSHDNELGGSEDNKTTTSSINFMDSSVDLGDAFPSFARTTKAQHITHWLKEKLSKLVPNHHCRRPASLLRFSSSRSDADDASEWTGGDVSKPRKSRRGRKKPANGFGDQGRRPVGCYTSLTSRVSSAVLRRSKPSFSSHRSQGSSATTTTTVSTSSTVAADNHTSHWKSFSPSRIKRKSKQAAIDRDSNGVPCQSDRFPPHGKPPKTSCDT